MLRLQINYTRYRDTGRKDLPVRSRNCDHPSEVAVAYVLNSGSFNLSSVSVLRA